MEITALAPWFGSKRTLAPRVVRYRGGVMDELFRGVVEDRKRRLVKRGAAVVPWAGGWGFRLPTGATVTEDEAWRWLEREEHLDTLRTDTGGEGGHA